MAKRIIKALLIIPAVAAALMVGSIAPAKAETQHTPNGLSDFMGGVLPPPGVYWLNYLSMVTKDAMYDKDGDKVKGIDVDATVWFDALRFVYMSKYKILGADYGAQVIFPIYTADVSVKTSAGASIVDSDSSGLGDIVVNPIILAWHLSPNLHIGAGLDIVLPTGNYDKDEAATQILAKNHYTFEPLVAISWWQKDGFDASAKIMYDFHTNNTSAPGGGTLKPGQEFHFDWAISHAIKSEDWRAGLTGYYYTTVTKDKQGGVSDDASSIMALGAAVKYWPKMGPLSFTLKYMQEFEAENTLSGSNLWFNFVWAL